MNEAVWVDTAQEWLVTNGASFIVNFAMFLLILLIGKFAIRWMCTTSTYPLRHRLSRNQCLTHNDGPPRAVIVYTVRYAETA